MADTSEPIRVFISYSHDSDKHAQRVRRLSDRLRGDGIDCRIDQYETAPAEGWRRWMDRQIAWADFVLVVCTDTYHRRARGKEIPGRGLGATYEASLLLDLLYEAGMRNERTIPLLLEGADVDSVPLPLRAYTRYHLDNPDDEANEPQYQALYRHLTDQPRIAAPELGSIRSLPTERSAWPGERPEERPTGPTEAEEPSLADPPSKSGPTEGKAGSVNHPTGQSIAGSRKLPTLAILIVCLVLGAALLHLANRPGLDDPQALDDIFQHIEAQGYVANRSLAGRYLPGDVLQVREPDPSASDDAGRLLATPLPALRAEECFPDLAADEAPFPLPDTEGKQRSTLGIEGARLAEIFPGLQIADSAARSYRLNFDRPRVRSHAKLDLSGSFPPSCVEKLHRALAAGDASEWFATVLEVVEARGMSFEVFWQSGLASDTKAEIQQRASAALATLTETGQTPDSSSTTVATALKVVVTAEDEHSTILQVETPVVLGYRTRPMEVEPKSSDMSTSPLDTVAFSPTLEFQEKDPEELSNPARDELEDFREIFITTSITTDDLAANLNPDSLTANAERFVGRLALWTQLPDASWKRVSTQHPFKTGELFRFEVEASRDAALFVFHQPPNGETSELWPKATGALHLVGPGRSLLVPSPETAFKMEGTMGEETFFVALTNPAAAPSGQKVESLANFVLRGLGTADTRGLRDPAAPWLYFAPGETSAYLAVVAFRLQHAD